VESRQWPARLKLQHEPSRAGTSNKVTAPELGITTMTAARPIQAALTSAATFSIGAAMPLAMVLVSPASMLVPNVSIASLLFLALLGAIGAKAGGADVFKATLRVTFWGAFAMALTAGIGALVGSAVWSD
jgi:VIT1/CCC1 family predicted Fe2+/Mn2+ transporter